VNAGCDLVAYTDAGAAVTARNVLLQAVKSGQIPQARVDEAARRVLALKAQAGLFSPSASEPVFDPAAHAQLVRELASQAVSMVGAANLPLVSADRVVLITPDTLPVGSQEGDGLSLLGELLTNKGIQVDEWVYPVDDAAGISAIQSQALAAAQRYPQTLIVASDALLNQAQDGNSAQVNLINALQSSGRPVLVIAIGSPFDLALVPASGVGVAIYGSLPPQIEALAEALLSPAAPAGTLPVPLSR
jgi:beta-N-acetylhexosaminidase